jgi:hypothetical protein
MPPTADTPPPNMSAASGADATARLRARRRAVRSCAILKHTNATMISSRSARTASLPARVKIRAQWPRVPSRYLGAGAGGEMWHVGWCSG